MSSAIRGSIGDFDGASVSSRSNAISFGKGMVEVSFSLCRGGSHGSALGHAVRRHRRGTRAPALADPKGDHSRAFLSVTIRARSLASSGRARSAATISSRRHTRVGARAGSPRRARRPRPRRTARPAAPRRMPIAAADGLPNVEPLADAGQRRVQRPEEPDRVPIGLERSRQAVVDQPRTVGTEQDVPGPERRCGRGPRLTGRPASSGHRARSTAHRCPIGEAGRTAGRPRPCRGRSSTVPATSRSPASSGRARPERPRGRSRRC